MGRPKKATRQSLQIEWRRQKVLEYAADGHSNREISTLLKIPHATVDRDIIVLRQQAKNDIHKYITEQVPFEYKKTLAGLDGIIKYTSDILTSGDDGKYDTKEKMQAANIKMQAYNMKMEMLSGANLVEEGIDLVERYKDYAIANINNDTEKSKQEVLKNNDGTEQPT